MAFLLFKRYESIACEDLEELCESGIQRLCRFSEMLLYRNSKICDSLFPVDKGPDEAAVFVQMNVCKSGFLKQLLGYGI